MEKSNIQDSEKICIVPGIRKYDRCIRESIWTSPDYFSYDVPEFNKHFISTNSSVKEEIEKILKTKEEQEKKEQKCRKLK